MSCTAGATSTMPFIPTTRAARVVLPALALALSAGLLATRAGQAIARSSGSGTGPAATAPAPETRPATAPSPPVDPAVDALLADLSSGDWRARDRAVGRLADLGEAVENRVRRFARDARGEEARDRARAVLARLAADRRMGPTRVTLHLRDATPQAAFAELARQGGLFIRARRESLWRERDYAPLTLDLVEVPFWEAAKAVCAATGLRPMFEGGHGGDALQLVLVPDATGEMTGPVAPAGQVTVLVDSLIRRPPPDGGDPAAAAGDAELRLAFLADPRWRVVEYPPTATLSAVAEAGGPQLPAPDPLTLQPFLGGSPRWAMRGVIKMVPPGAKRLARVTGTLRLTLAELSPPAVVDDVLKAANVVARAGPVALTLLKVDDQEHRLFTARLVLPAVGGGNEPSAAPEAVADSIWLVDRAGRPLRRNDFNVPDIGRLNIQYEAGTFDSPAPTRLVWRVPVGTPREVDLRFTFTDVPVTD